MTADLDYRLAEPRYKSYGEGRIAAVLDQYGVPYQYERPLLVIDRNKERIWYAGLSGCRMRSVAVEYFGLAGQPEYDRSIDHKTQVYAENGIGMVPVRREHLGRELPDYLMGGIERILQNRYERFRAAARRYPARYQRVERVAFSQKAKSCRSTSCSTDSIRADPPRYLVQVLLQFIRLRPPGSGAEGGRANLLDRVPQFIHECPGQGPLLDNPDLDHPPVPAVVAEFPLPAQLAQPCQTLVDRFDQPVQPYALGFVPAEFP